MQLIYEQKSVTNVGAKCTLIKTFAHIANEIVIDIVDIEKVRLTTLRSRLRIFSDINERSERKMLSLSIIVFVFSKQKQTAFDQLELFNLR